MHVECGRAQQVVTVSSGGLLWLVCAQCELRVCAGTSVLLRSRALLEAGCLPGGGAEAQRVLTLRLKQLGYRSRYANVRPALPVTSHATAGSNFCMCVHVAVLLTVGPASD